MSSSKETDEIGSHYDLIVQLSDKGLIDSRFLRSQQEFESGLKVLRYNVAELTSEKAAIEGERERLLREHDIMRTQWAQGEVDRQSCARLLEQAQGQIANLNGQIRVLKDRLARIEGSSLWRMTSRLRSGLAQRTGLRRFLRRSAKLVYWTATLQLAERYRWYKARQVALAAGDAGSVVYGEESTHQAEVVDSETESSGAFNSGWYGARRLERDELFDRRTVLVEEQGRSDQFYEGATRRIAAIYDTDGNSSELTLLRRIAPIDLISSAFAAAVPADSPSDRAVRSSFTIITPFYGHIKFFEMCAASVAKVIAADVAERGQRVEWIIVNDDPRYDVDEILRRVPDAVRAQTQILSDGENHGIASRLNEACSLGTSDWLLFLDCDDELEPHALAVLDHYIARFPQCRYISSGLIDIDEAGRVIRWRRNSDPTKMFEEGMTVGHLKAVRRDLFDEVGPYRRQHSGCQDYDFALRTALREPILCIPEYLYRYRWHAASQSVGSKIAQATRTIHVLRDFLKLFADRNWPERGAVAQGPATAKPDLKSGLCLIRTQGTRLELLAETVASVSAQEIPITACVAVHGSAEIAADVKRWLASQNLEAEVIEAPDLKRKRGYPLNVGLNYLRQNADKYDFFFFLDDDDIVYPFYATRLTELANLTGADLAVCGSSSRIPWEATRPGHALKPISALVAGNFIPIHSYIVRTEFLTANSIQIDEEMDYLEDWDFLISAFAARARFAMLPEVLCEYRIISDGNTESKKNPIHYEFCRARVMERAKDAAVEFGLGRFLRDISEFDFQEYPEFLAPEIGHLLDTRHVYAAGRAGTPL